MKLILSIITAIGKALFYLWTRSRGSDARKEKLLEELAKIRNEMDDSLRDRDYVKYHNLVNKRMLINKKIARLEK